MSKLNTFDLRTNVYRHRSNINLRIYCRHSIYVEPIVVDQGLDTTAISFNQPLPNELKETQYSIEIDDRFGFIASPGSPDSANLSFVDDDFIATYVVNSSTFIFDIPTTTNQAGSVIAGPRGTRLSIQIGAQLNLQQGDYYFDTFGTTEGINTKNCKVINSMLRISGLTTGYTIDIPIKFAKVI